MSYRNVLVIRSDIYRICRIALLIRSEEYESAPFLDQNLSKDGTNSFHGMWRQWLALF